MNKLTVLVGILILALGASIGFNAYQISQNSILLTENREQTSELEMVSILAQVKVNVDAELREIGSSVVYASQQLSTIGLGGEQASAVLGGLVANSSFIVDARISNLNNTVVTVEPVAHRGVEGFYIGEQDYLNRNSRYPIQPTLTNVVPLVEGFNGSVVVAPIFGSNGLMIGSVSVAIDSGGMIEVFVDSAVFGTHYTMWSTQTDGLVIYDADPDQRGLMLFSDSAYADFPPMLFVMHQIVDETSGHNTYQYLKTLASGQLVSKEAIGQPLVLTAQSGAWL